MIDKSIQQLDDLLADISRLTELKPDELQLRQLSISGWSVAQQLDHTLKEGVASLEDVRRLLTAVRAESFRPANSPIIRHPFFGGLTPAQTLRSIVVHTRHHLRIAREIIAAR